jgi:hypothetical protein
MSGGNLALLIWIGGWLITWLPLAYAMECGRQKGNTWGKGPRGRETGWNTPAKCLGAAFVFAAPWPILLSIYILVTVWDLGIHKLPEWAGAGLEKFVRKTAR